MKLYTLDPDDAKVLMDPKDNTNADIYKVLHDTYKDADHKILELEAMRDDRRKEWEALPEGAIAQFRRIDIQRIEEAIIELKAAKKTPPNPAAVENLAPWERFALEGGYMVQRPEGGYLLNDTTPEKMFRYLIKRGIEIPKAPRLEGRLFYIKGGALTAYTASTIRQKITDAKKPT